MLIFLFVMIPPTRLTNFCHSSGRRRGGAARRGGMAGVSGCMRRVLVWEREHDYSWSEEATTSAATWRVGVGAGEAADVCLLKYFN
jgi:hypothetical protein